ncbi:hypothetical protein ACC697_38365, partial [Rhizobium ruizarguesonis]
ISQLRPDLFFLGVTAAHPVHGLSTGDCAVEIAIRFQLFGRHIYGHDQPRHLGNAKHGAGRDEVELLLSQQHMRFSRAAGDVPLDRRFLEIAG